MSKILIVFILMSILFFVGCTSNIPNKAPSVPTQTYSCPDGSVVTDLSACPPQQANQKLSLTLKIITPSVATQYIQNPVITIANDGDTDAANLVIDAELYKGSKLVTSQSGVYLMAGSNSVVSVGAGRTVKGYLNLMWYSGNTDISDGVYMLKVSVRKGADATVISQDSASVNIGS